MKVKLIITATVKQPEEGDAYGGYGIAGRSGYAEFPIKKVKRDYIIVEDKMILKEVYYYNKVMNKRNKKVKVILHVK